MNEADKYKRDQDLFFQELDRQEVQYERMRVHRLFERAKAVGMSYATTRLKLGLKHFTLDELEAEVCQKENAGQAPPIAIARSLPLLTFVQKRVIHSLSKSSCCRALQQLVRSREGNFVTQNCIACQQAKTLTRSEIPHVQCPSCPKLLRATLVGKNYGFQMRFLQSRI